MALRIRRGTDIQRSGVILESGEIAWTTDARQLWVGDGLQQGGYPVVGSNVAGYGLSYNATSHKLEVAGLTADDIANGVNNKFFSTELAQDAAATLFTNPAASHSNIEFQYDDALNVVNATVTLDGIGITNVADDTSPSLGGDLDAASYSISNLNDLGVTSITADSIGVDSLTVTTLDATNLGSNLALNNNSITGSGNINYTGSLTINQTADVQLRQVLDGVTIKGYITSTLHRGTFNSPTAVQAGDELGGLLLKAYTNTTNSAIAGVISFIVDPTAVISGGDYVKSLVVISASSDTGQDEASAFVLDSNGTATVRTISVGDGDAVNPSITFSSDGGVDTGFFHPLDGVVCISTNAQERVRVDTGGMRVDGFMKVKDFAGNLPNPPEAGMIVLDGSTFKGYNGTSWVNLN